MDNSPRTSKDLISEFLARTGKKKNEVAKILGISTPYVTQITKGIKNADARFFEFAEKLKVSIPDTNAATKDPYIAALEKQIDILRDQIRHLEGDIKADAEARKESTASLERRLDRQNRAIKKNADDIEYTQRELRKFGSTGDRLPLKTIGGTG